MIYPRAIEATCVLQNGKLGEYPNPAIDRTDGHRQQQRGQARDEVAPLYYRARG